MLEARGFVYRKYEATIPPAVTYGLTSRMDEMRPVLEQLDRLAGIWYEEDDAPGVCLPNRKPKWKKRNVETSLVGFAPGCEARAS